MATYFSRYYIEFQDNHIISPATWRVDILDSEGNAPTEPYQLIAAANPLVTERIDTGEDKFTYIIGKQITLSYEYTGNPNEPLPELFFEATERRFRAEVRKNGVLDGVYYIKPDFSQYPDSFPPFTISLKAVDGFSYLKGIRFNAWDEDGELVYEKISLYEAIMTRGLNQIFDEGTAINVMSSIYPNTVGDTYQMLFDTYVHTDIFYDFVEGPSTVYDVLMSFCVSFKARIITDQNQIWFLRIQDLNYPPYSVDRYTDASTVTSISLPAFLRSVGSSTSNDGIPINTSGMFRMLPAVKEANFQVKYKGINQVLNFDWSAWDGTDFDNWTVETNPVTKLIVGRTGSGQPDDPYKLFVPYPQLSTATDIQQQKPIGDIFLGDIYDFEMRYRFANVNRFRISISVTNNDSGGVAYRLLPSGEWVPGNDTSALFTVSRNGNKREGTLKIKSQPIPLSVSGGGENAGPFGFRIEILQPTDPQEREPSEPDGVEIYPIKLGIISLSSQGRHLRITNTADFSQVRDQENFTFIDTGEDGVSNTLFVGDSMIPEDGGWESPKAGVNPGDIERFMAISVIDQYQRSVNSWEAVVYSNSLNFYNVIELAHKVGKVWMQLSDSYNNRSCEHQILIAETFEERPTAEPPNENYTISEWDIEEEND